LIDIHVHLHILFTLRILLFIFVSSWSFTRVGPAVQSGELLPVHKLLVLLQTGSDNFFSLDLWQSEQTGEETGVSIAILDRLD
jgi:hypothetical protein